MKHTKNSENSEEILLKEAVDAAVRWAKTDLGYFSMRDKVEAYLQAYTPESDPRLWYVYNSRKLGAERMLMKCNCPLTPAELRKLDREVMDIASTLPNNVIRGMHR